MTVSRRHLSAHFLVALSVAMVVPLLAAGCHRQGKTGPTQPVEEVFQQAQQKMKKKRYYAARALLQSLQARIPQDDTTLLPQVQIGLADAYYRDGGILNLGEALNAYRTFLTYYPQREEAAYAQYQVAMCYFGQVLAPDRDQDLTYKAIAEFEKVERFYPDSPYVEKARQRVLDCREQLAAHNVFIGRFYYKRKKYLAAASRFRIVLDKYPHYSGTEEVLFLLGSSLYATANPNEGRLYFQRLLQDYPKSKHAREARQLLNERKERKEQEKG